MAEYKLKFTEEADDGGRPEALNELIAFMRQMEGLRMSVVSLDHEQSENWDRDGEGELDYQNYYGEQIVQEIREHDPEAECIVIRNSQGLPVAMASRGVAESSAATGWQGISVDKRLRAEIAKMIGLDDYQLEEPLG